jgi:hypothetical protein
MPGAVRSSRGICRIFLNWLTTGTKYCILNKGLWATLALHLVSHTGGHNCEPSPQTWRTTEGLLEVPLVLGSEFSTLKVVRTRISVIAARFLISLNSSSRVIGVVLPPPLISEVISKACSEIESTRFSENFSKDPESCGRGRMVLNLALNTATAGSVALANSGRIAGAHAHI